MKRILRIEEEGIERMLVLIAAGLLATFWIGMWAAEAQERVPTQEIRANLCSKELCLSKWSNITILACQPNQTVPPRPDTDVIFGSFILSNIRCLCPCNFPKFYP